MCKFKAHVLILFQTPQLKQILKMNTDVYTSKESGAYLHCFIFIFTIHR